MKVINFKVNMRTAFTDPQLIRGGWQVVEKDKLYIKFKNNYKYSYIIKAFGKIRVSEILCEQDREADIVKYEEYPEFSLEEGWANLWNKSFIPASVDILMKHNIFDFLIENNWKPSVLGVIDYMKDDNSLTYYYPAPEGENIYKLIDDNPLDVMNFISKFRSLNLL